MENTAVSTTLPGAFTVTAGDGAGRVIRFQGPGIPVIFGRAADCGERFDEASISRIHACAACIGDCYVVSDAGSLNGTFVNGRRIDAPTILEHGDLVRLGTEIALRFSLRDAEEDTGLIPAAHSSDRDPLTGMPGRTWGERQIELELHKARESTRTLSVLLIEVDRFPQLVDLHGSQAGDEVLAGAARVIGATIRNTDVPAILGRTEFLVIAPNTPVEDAYWVAERIRDQIASASFSHRGQCLKTTVSIGVASPSCCGSQADRLTLLFLAHQRAWLARRTGDCVVNRGGSVSALIPSDCGDSTVASPGQQCQRHVPRPDTSSHGQSEVPTR